MRWGPCQRVTPSNLYYRYRVRGYLIDAWATHEWVPIIVTSPRGPLADVGIIEGREDDTPEYHGWFVTYA